MLLGVKLAPPTETAPAHVAQNKIAEPPKRKRPRPYFVRLNPSKDMKKQIASRIVQYLAAESDEMGAPFICSCTHSPTASGIATRMVTTLGRGVDISRSIGLPRTWHNLDRPKTKVAYFLPRTSQRRNSNRANGNLEPRGIRMWRRGRKRTVLSISEQIAADGSA